MNYSGGPSTRIDAVRPRGRFFVAAAGLALIAAGVVWFVLPKMSAVSGRDPHSLVLTQLRDAINAHYGFDENRTPRINCGPCARFALLFRDEWQRRFGQTLNIVFVMSTDADESGHVVVKLPDGRLFDGGNGILTEQQLKALFQTHPLEEMTTFDRSVLDRRVGGLEQAHYPRCPNYSDEVTANLIRAQLEKLRD